MKNLQPGEAVVIIDYKMKLELGMRSREIQRDWYGKRGISLHGFDVIAQVAVGERRIDVLDLCVKTPSKMPGLPSLPLMLALLGWKKCFRTFKSIYFQVRTCTFKETYFVS